MRRALVLGLDGGSIDLIKSWKKHLPNFRFLLENGVYGKLESTIPSSTCPAWNCMFTGKNPAKIGIFHFIQIDKEKQPHVVNLTYQDSASLWDILSDSHLKVGIMNVPTAYPPVQVNGFMVCGGLLTLSKKSYTFPSSLKHELNKISKQYEIVLPADVNIEGLEDEYIELYERVLTNQVNMTNYLMKRYSLDVFINVFEILDIVQHYFWAYMDRNHPEHDPAKARKYGETIKEFYKKIDDVIGEIIAEMPEDTDLMIVSDHGFGPCYGSFFMNGWLKENGFLVLKREGSKSLLARKMVSFVNFIRLNISPVILEAFLGIIPLRVISWFSFKEKAKRFYETIDWSRTKAYEVGNGIFINKEVVGSEKEYEALRDEIARKLYEIRDPKTGRRVVTEVFRKEEIYCGKHINRAPNLLYVSHFTKRFAEGRLYITGDHRLNGMFIAYGPDIKKEGIELSNMKIYDITPTILHTFGVPIPNDVDGRVLKEIFRETSDLAKRPVEYEKIDEKRRVRRTIRRLKSLGKV